MELPSTLTEAQAHGPILVVYRVAQSAANFRSIPYAERYREATAAIETPVEVTLQAAADEQRRQTAERR